MSQKSINVNYNLEKILSRLENKIDKQSEKIVTIKDALEKKIDKLEGKIEKIERKINQQSEEIAGIKGTLNAQQPLIDKITDLAENLGEINHWRRITTIPITAIISGSIIWVIRGLNIKP